MDWKDLEIGNIPSDFFVNDRYEIECFASNCKWVSCQAGIKNKTSIIIELVHGKDSLYRYRLKPLEPLEPIRITKEIAGILMSHTALSVGGTLTGWNNRPVEVID